MADAHVRDAKDKMAKSLEALRQELTHIRTGRASTGLLDGIEVTAYGAKMKLNQLANITAPEPRLLVISPFDKTQVPAIERAIMASPLELTPSNDGQVIRLPFPQLTEERRKDLVKLIGKYGEETRVAVRNIRRHHMDEIKKEQKEGVIPEDDAHKLSAEIQKATDDTIEKIEETLKAKEEEIMEV